MEVVKDWSGQVTRAGGRFFWIYCSFLSALDGGP